MTFDILVDLTPLDTGSRYSGTGRYVFELGAALADLSPSECDGISLGSLTSVHGETGSLRWPGSDIPKYAPHEEVKWLNDRRLQLSRSLRRLRPRAFHATYHMGTPRLGATPRVVTCLDLVRLALHEDYLPGRWFYREVLRATEKARFQSAARVQCISHHTANDLMRICSIPASKIDVVHLGVDLARYYLMEGDDQVEAARTCRKHGLEPEGYVFYMGAADPRKNIDVLIHAFAQAGVEGLDLVLIGKMRPSDQARIDAALAAAGNPPRVRQLGFVDEADLPALIGQALGFVFCSTYEGFGNVPVEAMACGCPVIHTGRTSLAETVADAGLEVAGRDVTATAEAIRLLARDSALRADLRRQGLRRAQQFSWRNTALATVESYRNTLRDLS